jgi:predicted deacylase
MIGAHSLHSYSKAGAKAWSRAAALDLRRMVTHELGSIRSAHPRLASLYAAGVEQALAYFEESGVRSQKSE